MLQTKKTFPLPVPQDNVNVAAGTGVNWYSKQAT